MLTAQEARLKEIEHDAKSEYAKDCDRIWNAAIEAAADVADLETGIEMRKLKK